MPARDSARSTRSQPNLITNTSAELTEENESTETITGDNDVSMELFTQVPQATNTTHRTSFSAYEQLETPDSIAIKLDRLNDKRIRFESHLTFTKKCQEEDLIPHSLRPNLEASLGNHDEEYMKEFMAIQNKCSTDLLALNHRFCKKTIEQTKESLHTYDRKLKEALPQDKYTEVRHDIVRKGQSQSNYLHRQKVHKLNSLKYGMKTTFPEEHTTNTERKERYPNNRGRYQTQHSQQRKYETQNQQRQTHHQEQYKTSNYVQEHQ